MHSGLSRGALRRRHFADAEQIVAHENECVRVEVFAVEDDLFAPRCLTFEVGGDVHPANATGGGADDEPHVVGVGCPVVNVTVFFDVEDLGVVGLAGAKVRVAGFPCPSNSLASTLFRRVAIRPRMYELFVSPTS